MATIGKHQRRRRASAELLIAIGFDFQSGAVFLAEMRAPTVPEWRNDLIEQV